MPHCANFITLHPSRTRIICLSSSSKNTTPSTCSSPRSNRILATSKLGFPVTRAPAQKNNNIHLKQYKQRRTTANIQGKMNRYHYYSSIIYSCFISTHPILHLFRCSISLIIILILITIVAILPASINALASLRAATMSSNLFTSQSSFSSSIATTSGLVKR